ncbi:hypothetical protein PHYPSEUDO_005064 [Phytophthora pseudosyringae]|uniref:RING-type domain-containing protein n=1 Tax=Phytophthora pseudosyringae TaxID=221518 RepID=A0A8T1VMY0_9STRA|nr:hypothetical protein PHYPSEUDO_005064 [Phytophthora pseudosyringae]
MQTQTRGQEEEDAQHKARFVDVAQESKSVLLELGSILNQRYRNRGPSHQTQRSLQRKNEVVSRLEQFIIEYQRSREREGGSGNQEAQRATIERLEKQLQDQSAVFDQERARLQQQATTKLNAQADLNSSLNKVLPELRGLLEAYDREQRPCVDLALETATRTVTITGDRSVNPAVTRPLDELRTAFDEERAQLLEQASDAVKTQQDVSRRNLTEREAVLTCPISLDLFENPVLTTCCGKTFSSEALAQALRRNPQCPVCRAHRVATHANRDVANLVELHRSERSVLGLSENAAATSATAAPDANDGSVAAPASTSSGHPHRNQEADSVPNAPQTRNRSQRSERVQARSAVPHRQSSRTTVPVVATRTATPPSSGASTRGRRRGGRGSGPRRRRTSRSSASPTSTATSQAAQRVVSRNNTAPSSSASAAQMSAVQSPSWAQAWGSSNAAPQSSTASAALNIAGIGASANALAHAWGSTAASYSNQGSLTGLMLQQNSRSYSRRPTDDEFTFYPYADIGYYESDSDY